tara:strand:+ start:17 stop:799 length:783 start_codon:yes stop_codon:yes gene_type:complete
MDHNKAIKFLYNLSNKLSKFYISNSKKKIIINNKSKRKKVFNPVTNFDKNFEKMIRAKIMKLFPNDGIIGEEFKNKKSKNNKCWIIDPIDGTKAFVAGLPTWSNLVGMMYKKKSIMGMANFPELKKTYMSYNNFTYSIEKTKKKKLKTNSQISIKKSKILCNFHNQKKNSKYFKKLVKLNKNVSKITLDALSYCLLAEGKIDAVIESDLKIYDVAAIIPIVKNSGGFITTWNNKSAEKSGNILATSNKKLHNKLLKLLKS